MIMCAVALAARAKSRVAWENILMSELVLKSGYAFVIARPAER
jgi:hypothetical protein